MYLHHEDAACVRAVSRPAKCQSTMDVRAHVATIPIQVWAACWHKGQEWGGEGRRSSPHDGRLPVEEVVWRGRPCDAGDSTGGQLRRADMWSGPALVSMTTPAEQLVGGSRWRSFSSFWILFEAIELAWVSKGLVCYRLFRRRSVLRPPTRSHSALMQRKGERQTSTRCAVLAQHGDK